MPIFEMTFVKRSLIYVEARSRVEAEAAVSAGFVNAGFRGNRLESVLEDNDDGWEQDDYTLENEPDDGGPPEFGVLGGKLVNHAEYRAAVDEDGDDERTPPPDTRTLPMFGSDGLTPLSADERARLAAKETP